jgi:hypothetical protein
MDEFIWRKLKAIKAPSSPWVGAAYSKSRMIQRPAPSISALTTWPASCQLYQDSSKSKSKSLFNSGQVDGAIYSSTSS